MNTRFEVIEGTTQEINNKLNELAKQYFVKVTSSCINLEGLLVVVLYLKNHTNEKG